MIISGGIDLSKLDKDNPKHIKRINGKPFLDFIMVTKEDSKYNNDGFIAVSTSKEDRDAGVERGPIIGNFKILVRDQPKAPSAPQQEFKPAHKATEFGKDDDIPF